MVGKILIVDADPHVGSLLGEILAMHGHDAQTAKTPQEAVSKMRARPADLVLIDQDIPGVFSGELVPSLRGLAQFSDGLFRVMFVAMACVPEPVDYQRAGFVYVLPKPFDFEQLERVVDGCVQAVALPHLTT